jgi:hypothetical protein
MSVLVRGPSIKEKRFREVRSTKVPFPFAALRHMSG